MYISVRRYRIGSGSAEEVLRRVKEEFVPIVSGAPGFRGYHLIDRGDGTFASVNIFADRAGAEESNRRAADWVRERVLEFELSDILAGFEPSDVEIVEGEVVLSKGAPLTETLRG